MELKDVILSTLAEMEDEPPKKKSSIKINEKKIPVPKVQKIREVKEEKVEYKEQKESKDVDTELIYLSSVRERLLVLFEGFQAPNNSSIEAKIDMTLNFLEYILATIDSRIELLEKGHNK